MILAAVHPTNFRTTLTYVTKLNQGFDLAFTVVGGDNKTFFQGKMTSLLPEIKYMLDSLCLTQPKIGKLVVDTPTAVK